MTDKPPLCRYCGKPIAKETTTVYFGNLTHTAANWRAEKPASLKEAAALYPGKMLTVKWTNDAENGGRYIWRASFWDGESYASGFFCTTHHAAQFGKVMAQYGHSTKAYCVAMTAQKEKAGASPDMPWCEPCQSYHGPKVTWCKGREAAQ